MPTPTPTPDRPRSRMEEDIREILDRVDLPDGPANGPAPDDRPRATPRDRSHLRLVRPKPARRGFSALPPVAWFGAAIVLTLAALFMSSRSQNITLILAIAAIAALLVPLFLRRSPVNDAPLGRGPSSLPSGTKTWRGRDITLSPSANDSPVDKVRRWVDRSRHGR